MGTDHERLMNERLPPLRAPSANSAGVSTAADQGELGGNGRALPACTTPTTEPSPTLGKLQRTGLYKTLRLTWRRTTPLQGISSVHLDGRR